MLSRFIIAVCLIVAIGVVAIAGAEGLFALVITAGFSLCVLYVIRSTTDDSRFVTYVFLLAVAVRLTLATVIYVYQLFDFFGPDALAYDIGGKTLVELWGGRNIAINPDIKIAIQQGSPGWGMHYLVGIVYYVFGSSMLYVQAFCVVIGAATSPAIYACARKIYGNRQVARVAAIGIALFPSFIIWSSQLLKDGLIVFLIVFSILMVLSLREKFDYLPIALLVFSLIGVATLRFYIFYIVLAAVAGSFFIGSETSVKSIVRRISVITLLGIALAFLGVWQNATAEFARFGTFDRLKLSRQYAASASESGFADAEKIDVSTPLGALSVLPVGLAYLMLAPFPWQVTNFRQAVTLPEIFLWWSLIPLGIWGLWFTLRTRLAAASPVLIFTILLTISYAVYQGNVGTAYRQRTQIQVFVFMFIAVGVTLWMEKREDKRMQERNRAMQSPLRSFELPFPRT